MRQESGFSLVEVLVAIMITAFILLGFASIPRMTSSTHTESESNSIAINLAESILESYHNVQFNSMMPVTLADLTIETAGHDLTYQRSVNVIGYNLGSYSTNINMYGSTMLTNARDSSNITLFNAADVKVVTVTVSCNNGFSNIQIIRRAIFYP